MSRRGRKACPVALTRSFASALSSLGLDRARAYLLAPRRGGE